MKKKKQQQQQQQQQQLWFMALLLSLSLLLVLRPVKARPWGIISAWGNGWHSMRQRRHVDSTTSVCHPHHPPQSPLNIGNTLNYTAITILHVGNDDDAGGSSSTTVDAMIRPPPPGCLLEYSIGTNETRISNERSNKQETVFASFGGSKWMPAGSTTPSASSSNNTAWTALSNRKNHDDDDYDAFLALAQAAAMTSHVVVLVLHNNNKSSFFGTMNPNIVQALQAGFARRHEQAGLSQGSLVIVLNDNGNKHGPDEDGENNDDIDIDAWRNDLVLDALQDVQPQHVYALELTSVQDYKSTLNNLLYELRLEPGQCDSLVPLQAFPRLLEQTYHSLLRKRSNQDNVPGLFDHDAASTQSTSESTSRSVANDGTYLKLSTRAIVTCNDNQSSLSNKIIMMKSLSLKCRPLLLFTDCNVENVVVQTQVDRKPNDAFSTTTKAAETIATTSTRMEMPTNSDNITSAVSRVQQEDVVNDPSTAEQYKQEQAAKLLLATCHERLDALEQQLEQVWFDATMENDDDDDVGYMILNDNSDESVLSSPPPPCDFAQAATLVLQDLQQAYSTILLSNKQLQDSVTANVGNRLSRLYQQHLQSLRDYYGKIYESMLDSHVNQDDNMKQQHGPWWRRQPFSQRKRRRPSAARAEKDLQKTVQAFRKAAQEAVPPLARRGNPFRDMDLDYVNVLQGLLADMHQAISLRESLVDLENVNDDQDDSDEEAKRGGLWGYIRRGRQQGAAATWYEKLAARAFVLSVNYAQGWLAWKAMQRAALEREREMPKFPIF
jgi:hypothetical protein